MPTDPIAAAGAIEKLGIVGVMALIVILAVMAAIYFRREMVGAYKIIDGLRDDISKLKQMMLIVKLAADQGGVKYDLGGVGDLEALLQRKA